MKRFELFLRGVTIVALTAANVVQIAGGHYAGAFGCASGISFVWWDNARKTSLSTIPYARETYAFGAGCGTVLGMVAMRLLYR